MVRVLRNPGCIPLLLRTDAQAGVRLAAGDAAPTGQDSTRICPLGSPSRPGSESEGFRLLASHAPRVYPPPSPPEDHALDTYPRKIIGGSSSRAALWRWRAAAACSAKLHPWSDASSAARSEPHRVCRRVQISRGLEHELTAPRRSGPACLSSSRSLHSSIPTSDGVQANGGRHG